jgi:hypothetical protein
MLAAVKSAVWLPPCIIALTACGRFGFAAAVDAGDAGDAGSGCSPPPGLAAGLAGWWKFDEPSGTVALDSASGNDGLLLGGSTRVAGHLGGAVALDGVTGRVEIGGASSYATHIAAFSFSAWVNLADWSSQEPDIMQIRTDSTPSPFHVLLSNSSNWNGISTGDGDGSWLPTRTNVQPSLATWHHIAVVYDGSNPLAVASFQVFLDGVAQPLTPASPYATQTNQSRIGAAESAGNYWSGMIDDVRIYRRALSAAEVGALITLTCD